MKITTGRGGPLPRFSRLRMSLRSQNLMAQLKSRTGMAPNVTGRLAICMSLGDPSPPNPDEFDERGSEIYPSAMFGEHEEMFMALMLQRLGEDGLDPDAYLNRMVRAHFNRGAIALFARVHEIADIGRVVAEEREAQGF